jgi:hypothetical protein
VGNNLKKERFILAHGFSPLRPGCVVSGPGEDQASREEACIGAKRHTSMAARKQRKKGTRNSIYPSKVHTWSPTFSPSE